MVANFKCLLMFYASIFTLFTFLTIAHSIPFVVFHGIADKCKGSAVTQFTKLLSNWSGSAGYCIEIGNGAWDSWTMPFPKQTTIACDKVKKMDELKNGYNIIGLSQGNFVGRGVVELCDDAPPVRNFISLAGPHAGIASVPLCKSAAVCVLVDYLVDLAVYSDYVQAHLAPAGYVKIPTDMKGYKKGCEFLPKINNEVYKNATYKQRFSSLNNLILIKFEQDNVLVPKETSWFGYFPDGSWTGIQPARKTKLYTEDWIGLKTLDEEGKVKFVNVSGGHLQISYGDMKQHILPYLLDDRNDRSRIFGLNFFGREMKKIINLHEL